MWAYSIFFVCCALWIFHANFCNVVASAFLEFNVVAQEEVEELLLFLATEVREVNNRLGHT